MLTLGQVRDVCLQIRAWLEAGETERAAYWSRRLRAEPARCSVKSCAEEPLPDRPWCSQHRVSFAREVESPRRGDILALLAEEPPLTDKTIAQRLGVSPWVVGRVRKQAGIPARQWRRWGYRHVREIPRRKRWRWS